MALRVEKAVSPVGRQVTWLLVDAETFALHPEGRAFSLFLRGAGRSPETMRAYLPRVARFLNWCTAAGVDWRTVSLLDLARFKLSLEVTPIGADARRRTGKSVNAVLTAICEYLRFCAAQGFIDAEVAGRLSERRFVRQPPAGTDPGEQGQQRFVRSRVLRAAEVTQPPDTLSGAQLGRLLSTCIRVRDELLITVMAEGGLRIGEALGLRREDMHLLPDSSHLQCAVSGAHVHVRPRQDNANGARVKSGRPRTVPVTHDFVELYRRHLLERETVLQAASCDFVFVNATGAHAGRPMSYSNAQQLIARLGQRCGVKVHPHMFRHTAATNWVRGGAAIDVVQSLLGHAQQTSTAVYLHASDEDRRAAVERAQPPRLPDAS